MISNRSLQDFVYILSILFFSFYAIFYAFPSTDYILDQANPPTDNAY